MSHKKKALDQQESQQLAPEAYAPAGREPMTGAQASLPQDAGRRGARTICFRAGLEQTGRLAAHRCAYGTSEARRFAAPH